MDFGTDPPYGSFASAMAMLGHLQTGSIQEAKELRKTYILDSFSVSNFHTSYKDWDTVKNNQVVEEIAPKYNELNSRVARSNDMVTKLSQKHQRAREKASFPSITLSRSAVEQLGFFEELLQRTPGIKMSFQLEDLFIVGKGDIRGGKIDPDFETVEKLIKLEYRIRMERRVQLAVLSAARTLLAAKSKKWTGRTMQLDDFMRKFAELTQEVDRIRQNEKEDLDYYSDEIEEDVEDMDDVSEDGEGEIGERGDDTRNEEIREAKEIQDKIEEDGPKLEETDSQEKVEDTVEDAQDEENRENVGGEINESVNDQENDESATDGDVEEPTLPVEVEGTADLEDELMNVDG